MSTTGLSLTHMLRMFCAPLLSTVQHSAAVHSHGRSERGVRPAPRFSLCDCPLCAVRLLAPKAQGRQGTPARHRRQHSCTPLNAKPSAWDIFVLTESVDLRAPTVAACAAAQNAGGDRAEAARASAGAGRPIAHATMAFHGLSPHVFLVFKYREARVCTRRGSSPSASPATSSSSAYWP